MTRLYTVPLSLSTLTWIFMPMVYWFPSLLHGGEGIDDGSVYDGSHREFQSLLLKVGVDFLKNPFSEAVGFENKAEECRWLSRREQNRSKGRFLRNASWIPCRIELLPLRSSLSETASARNKILSIHSSPIGEWSLPGLR